MIKAYLLVILEHITKKKKWTLYVVAKKKPEEPTTLGTPIKELDNPEDQYVLGVIEEALNLIAERGKLISVTQANSVGEIHKQTGEKIVEKYLVVVRTHPESD